MHPKTETKKVSLDDPALQPLLQRAHAGDQSVLPELQRFLDEHPQLWRKAGDLGWHALEAVLKAAAGKDLLLCESIRRKAAELKKELIGETTNPLECLLSERIALDWLQAHSADMDAATNATAATPLRSYFDRRQHAAHQRYMSAIKQLAVVRKLLKPSLSPLDMLRCESPESSATPNASEAKCKPPRRHGADDRLRTGPRLWEGVEDPELTTV